MPIGDYGHRPARTIAPDESARAAAQRMEKENVGCLVVVEGERPIGILTDRDIALRVLREKLDAGSVRVRELMQHPVTAVREDASVDDAIRAMRRGAVRRLPMVDAEGRLVGLLAVDDLVRLVATELGELAEALRVQLAGAARPHGEEQTRHA